MRILSIMKYKAIYFIRNPNVNNERTRDIPSTPHFHCDICKLVLLIQENTKVPLKTMDRLLDWIMKMCVLI